MTSAAAESAPDDGQPAAQHGARVVDPAAARRVASGSTQKPRPTAINDGLGGDRGGRVDAGGGVAEHVLGHDHVDVLQRGDERERGDRQRRATCQDEQRARVGCPRGRPRAGGAAATRAPAR